MEHFCAYVARILTLGVYRQLIKPAALNNFRFNCFAVELLRHLDDLFVRKPRSLQPAPQDRRLLSVISLVQKSNHSPNHQASDNIVFDSLFWLSGLGQYELHGRGQKVCAKAEVLWSVLPRQKRHGWACNLFHQRVKLWQRFGSLVILPFLVGIRSRVHVAMANRCFGVMPPKAMFGRSWL